MYLRCMPENTITVKPGGRMAVCLGSNVWWICTLCIKSKKMVDSLCKFIVNDFGPKEKYLKIIEG